MARTAVVALVMGLAMTVSAHSQDAPIAPIYRAGDPGVSTPTLVTSVHANYPGDALRRRVQGRVGLAAIIDRTGVPTKIEILDAVDAELDATCAEAFAQWRFRPGRKDGEPVAVRVTVVMSFSLPGKHGRRR